MDANRVIKHRNIFLVYLYGIITLGIYSWYWTVSTKNDINSKGEVHIPTAWLLIIPIVNLYWMYKYCEGFAKNIKKRGNAFLWFLLYLFVGIVIPLLVQLELNKLASGNPSPATTSETPTSASPSPETKTPVTPTAAPVATAA